MKGEAQLLIFGGASLVVPALETSQPRTECVWSQASSAVHGSRLEMFAVENIAVLKTFNVCLPLLQAFGVGRVINVLPCAT